MCESLYPLNIFILRIVCAQITNLIISFNFNSCRFSSTLTKQTLNYKLFQIISFFFALFPLFVCFHRSFYFATKRRYIFPVCLSFFSLCGVFTSVCALCAYASLTICIKPPTKWIHETVNKNGIKIPFHGNSVLILKKCE